MATYEHIFLYYVLLTVSPSVLVGCGSNRIQRRYRRSVRSLRLAIKFGCYRIMFDYCVY